MRKLMLPIATSAQLDPYAEDEPSQTLSLHDRHGNDGVMEEEMRRRLGIALAILGFLITLVSGVAVIGHYLVGWPVLDPPSFGIGLVFFVIGIAVANKKRPNSLRN